MSLPTAYLVSPTVDGGSSQPLAATATVTEPPSVVNDLRLVFNGDILLFAVFACFVLFSLPRAFIRFSCMYDWHRGHILWSTNPEKWRNRCTYVSPADGAVEKGISRKCSGLHTTHPGMHFEDNRPPTAAPSHARAISSIVHPIASPLARRIMPGFSVGQAIILGAYGAILQYESFYKSNPFTSPIRTGFVGTSQIPFVFALATKNNFLASWVGLGYEKVNYIHRFLGRSVTVLLDIHTIGYVYQWTSNGTFIVNSRQPDIVRSFVALACLNVMSLTSTSLIRQNWYKLFYLSHVTGFVIFLPTVCSHKPAIVPFVLAAVIIYGVDHLARLAKLRICTARIKPFPELETTHVQVFNLNAGWRAGQHVRLRVLSFSMGWWGWTENHPFTIASVSISDISNTNGLVLLCKQTGSWTTKLYDMAKASGYRESGKVAGRNVKVMIEGPYGGPGYTVFASYSAAIFICGGSGISFGLSTVQELVQRDLEGTSRVKFIELIWIIQDPASLVPLIPLFTSIIRQSSPAFINISVLYTRATAGVERIMKNCDRPGLSLDAGRPKISQALDSVISRAISLGSGATNSATLSGVVVGACGPVGLGDDVSEVVRQVDSSRRKAVGGVELYEEVFGW